MKKQSFIFLYIFLFSFITFAKKNKMKTHAYFTDLFKYNPVATEHFAYKILKEYPIKKDVNYLAVPWHVLIQRTKLPESQLIKKGKIDEKISLRLQGGFTICQYREYEEILPILKKIGIDVLFACHAKKGVEYDGITVLPFPHLAVNGVESAKEKDILYSFIGYQNNQEVRKQIFSLPLVQNCVIKERETWHYLQFYKQVRSNTQHDFKKKWRQEDREEYKDILARSRFSLCPRGAGPNTIRFWESLQAGAIPILLSDEAWLPEGIDWSKSIIKVAEKDVCQIHAIVQNISQEQEKHMRINCLQAYDQFSGINFVSPVRLFYNS